MDIESEIIERFIHRFREDGYAVIAIPIQITDELSDDDIKIELVRDLLTIAVHTERYPILCAFAKGESFVVDKAGGYEIVIRPILRDNTEV